MVFMGKLRQELRRRDALGLGAAALSGVALGAAPAYAVGERIDLAGPNTRWINEKVLHHTTVLQSFAFDELRGHIYAAQVMQGGVRLRGESRAYSHAEREARGDLCLNRLSMTGDHLDHMFLKGFGHGSAIGVEERGAGGPRLWTEGDASPASGYGRAIVRFRYAAGAVLQGSRGVTVFRPRPGTTNNNAALDLSRGRLLLRYRIHDAPRYTLYNFDDFVARRFTVLSDFPQPGADLGLPFQGMTLHGDYAYQVLGHSHDPDDPSSGAGDSRLYCIDVHTGEVVQQQPSPDVLSQLRLREPEGLAVLWRTSRPRLCMGFASGPAGGRKYSLYYKQA
jgi:receptor-binding protein